MKFLSRLIDRLRFVNRRIFNPVILKFAGSSYSPISVIRHVGRRSGKLYTTPVIVVLVDDGFVIALPYGHGVDWYRNVCAAGRGTIVWHGQEYSVETPQPLAAGTDVSVLPMAFRLVLRIVDGRTFIRVKGSRVIAGRSFIREGSLSIG